MNRVSKRRAALIIIIHDDSAMPTQLIESAQTAMETWEFPLIIANCTGGGRFSETIDILKRQHPGIYVIQNDDHRCNGEIHQEAIDVAVHSLHADAVIVCQYPSLQSEAHNHTICEHIENGAQLVLGTRNKIEGVYISKHGTSLPLLCKIKSQLLRALYFLPTKAWFRASDPQTPLMAFQASLYNDASAALTNYKLGTNYLQFLMYTLVRSTAEVIEIPIHGVCEKRIQGKALGQYTSAFRIRWRDHETKRFIKFGFVGFTGYIVNAVSLELFRHTVLTLTIAQYFQQFPNLSRFALFSSQSAWSAGFAAEIAIISNYLLNNFWTFSTHKIKSSVKFIAKLLQFNLTSFGGIVIQFFVIGLATRLFSDTAVVRGVALIFAIVFLIIPYNWTMYNRLIWRVKGRNKKK